MPKKRKIIVYCLVIAVFILLIVIYGKLNPENSQLFPKCPFRMLTGYKCPGCGSQRAIHFLLNLEIGSAVRANALLVFSIPYVILLIMAEFFREKNEFFRRLYHALFSPKAIWTVFAVVVVWWIARNFSNF